MAALQNPFFIVAVVIAAWALWRIWRWFTSGGRLPARGRRGTASGFGNAALSVQALFNPATRHVLELHEEQQSQREDDEDGAPPRPGGSSER